METKAIIFQKLEAFIKRFYTNEFIKGILLFIGLGLLYFIFTILVEYFLWLPVLGRTLLFWLFISVEFFLLIRFILFPLFKLFKFQKGINYEQASKIIGNHFAEINDKLTNFLQLANQNNSQNADNELLFASINQKAENLSPIPFSKAINFNTNKKYLPYTLVPIFLLVLFFVSGNSKIISQGLDRVVNYNTSYLPPAPFQFVILNTDLVTQQGKDFTLNVKTVGSVIPENVTLLIGEEEYILQNTNLGEFQYTFTAVNSNIIFSLKSNSITSKKLYLKVINVPTITNFEMLLSFPAYLKRKAEIIKGTGNAIIPEGTTVTWKLETLSTSEINYVSNNQKTVYSTKNGVLTFSKKLTQNIEYKLVTSNENLKDFENLDYQINIVKDQYPIIIANKVPDSLQTKKEYIIGQLSDDYGLSKLQVVYYPKDKPQFIKRATLPVKAQIVDQFVYAFPTGLDLEKGLIYDYYFEVFDNDVLNGFKSTKSAVFSHIELNDDQKQDAQLKDQNDNINSLEKSLKNQDKQLDALDKLQKMKKQKANLDFKDQKKIEEFLKKQQQQDEMMKDFTKKLSENLENFNPKVEDKRKEELLRRLDESQKQADKNENLLKELVELQKKLQDEELFEKVDKLKQNAKNQAKNLEQLVELTKRFYVEKKAEQIADKLEKLGDKEDKLADENKNNLDEQKKIAEEFDKIKDELEQLDKDNKDLKKPMDIPNDKNEQEDIQDDLEKSEDNLKNDDKPKASKSQKSAAQKIKEMSQKMSASMESGEMEQMEEDAKALRQILDNLLAFSYDEEALIQPTKQMQSRSLSINKILKKQHELKLQFQHVDDSIFAVSLRNPMISEFVLNEIGNIHYNLDKSMESIADNEILRGASQQQYVLSSANKLADFLSTMQSDMNMQMSGSGQGKGKPKPGQGKGGEKQLSDIIKKQEGLSEKMKEAMKAGKKPGDKPGDDVGEKSGKGKQEGKGQVERGEGEGEGSEGNTGKLLEILKEQQQLRDALQKSLDQRGVNGSKFLNQMKDIEKQLINKGFKNETLQKMLNINQELLKLETAVQQQGQDDKRKSNNSFDSFTNNTSTLPKELQDYIKSIEILNRQSLPLQKNYDQKVKDYFNK